MYIFFFFYGMRFYIHNKNIIFNEIHGNYD
ncbi:hypothetical protein C4A51_04534 [Escherichia coli]|nr:hypothetical protein C4A51_04534 [Escherichia coli]